METENKVSNDLYKVYGEAFMTKHVASSSDPLQSSTMLSKLNNVIGLASLDDNKINNLLRATDKI